MQRGRGHNFKINKITFIFKLMTFISKAQIIHNNKYDYSKVVYINTHTKVELICPYHGSFFVRPVKHIGKEKAGCQICSRESRLVQNRKFHSVEEVIAECNKVHNNTYTYALNLTENELITTNHILTCECIIHGIFTQTINKHLYQKTRCPACSTEIAAIKTRKTTEEFIAQATRLFGDTYSYKESLYEGAHKKLKIFCKIHGEFQMTPANHLLHLNGCPKCQASGPETVIMAILSEHNIPFKFQHSFDDCRSVKDHVLRFDFFLPQHNLIIEYDGIHHFVPIEYKNSKKSAITAFNDMIMNDNIKNKYAEQRGITMIRIPYHSNSNLVQYITDVIS